MKILHVAPSFYPATRWGGPIFSTKSLCDWAAGQPDMSVDVRTTDAAGPERSARLLPEDQKPEMEAGYPVSYYRRIAGHSISPQLLFALPGAIWQADIVHLTATYSFPTLPTLFFARLLRRPVVWSPRGAIQASHEWRDAPRQGAKRAFERLARVFAPARTVLLVTAESEAKATLARMPGMRAEVVPNSVELPDDTTLTPRSWRPDGQLRLLFLSRVHEKKGVDLLIDAMGRLGANVTLDIFGSGEDDYIAQLKTRVENLGLTGRVQFRGHVDGPQKTAAFRQADLFVLPSHSENFGIAIAEALAHGVPALTTDSTPWTMLEDKGCGRSIHLSVDTLVDCLNDLERQDLEAMGQQGRKFIGSTYGPAAVNAALRDIYFGLSQAHAPQDGRE